MRTAIGHWLPSSLPLCPKYDVHFSRGKKARRRSLLCWHSLSDKTNRAACLPSCRVSTFEAFSLWQFNYLMCYNFYSLFAVVITASVTLPYKHINWKPPLAVVSVWAHLLFLHRSYANWSSERTVYKEPTSRAPMFASLICCLYRPAEHFRSSQLNVVIGYVHHALSTMAKLYSVLAFGLVM